MGELSRNGTELGSNSVVDETLLSYSMLNGNKYPRSRDGCGRGHQSGWLSRSAQVGENELLGRQ